MKKITMIGLSLMFVLAVAVSAATAGPFGA